MATNNNPGCAAILSRLFATTPKSTIPEPEPLPPYRLRDDFLSPAELNFYRILQQTLGDKVVICLKVSLGDLFYPKTGNRSYNQTYRNKIDRKHVDFLLCDPKTMRPIIGLELDDASHEQRARQERDDFVEQIFAVAGLPLFRQPVRASYNTRDLLAKLEALTGLALQPNAPSPLPREPATTPPPQPATTLRNFEQTTPAISLSDGDVPGCPKCKQPMVLRTVKKAGPHYGNQFWGCSDYPQCRGVRPYQ